MQSTKKASSLWIVNKFELLMDNRVLAANVCYHTNFLVIDMVGFPTCVRD